MGRLEPVADDRGAAVGGRPFLRLDPQLAEELFRVATLVRPGSQAGSFAHGLVPGMSDVGEGGDDGGGGDGGGQVVGDAGAEGLHRWGFGRRERYAGLVA